MQKKLNQRTCIAGCLVLTVLLFCGCRKENDLVIETAQTESAVQTDGVGQTQEATPGHEEASGQETMPAGEQQPEVIYVQVTGAVKHPGVYELEKGSRVFEAVQKAGGMTEDAAPESLNQAVEVSDGEMIVLYTRKEWELRVQAGDTSLKGAAQGDADSRVNINTADLNELCTIPGIGKTRAESIITYREQNGAFGSVEEIMKVNGIKEGLFDKIKDKIKV